MCVAGAAPQLRGLRVVAGQPTVVVAHVDGARDGIESGGRGGNERFVLRQPPGSSRKLLDIRHASFFPKRLSIQAEYTDHVSKIGPAVTPNVSTGGSFPNPTNSGCGGKQSLRGDHPWKAVGACPMTIRHAHSRRNRSSSHAHRAGPMAQPLRYRELERRTGRWPAGLRKKR